MNCLDFYDGLGADSANVVRRLGNETFVRKYLKKFAEDTTVGDLNRYVAEKEYENAFRAAHTVKGLALNLELLPLNGIIVDLTEILRKAVPESDDKIKSLLLAFNKEYNTIIQKINMLQ